MACGTKFAVEGFVPLFRPKQILRDVSSSESRRIVIVGNGMVGLRFCEEFIKLVDEKEVSLHIIGDESLPAYDRVNLAKIAKGYLPEEIVLRSRSWYRENGISLITGQRVTGIDIEANCVTFEGEREAMAFDQLILATGSRAYLPPIPGVELAGVHSYRNIADLTQILEETQSAKTVAVIGGGLLGLEAAEFLADRGMETTLLQLGDFLMSAQLNQEASQVLRQKVESLGIKVLTRSRTESISRDSSSSLSLKIVDGEALSFDMIVFAAGIVPNTEIAAEAGLRCGVNGGVIVSDTLQSSEPHVFAIGECALHRNQIYGLVAPGYAMASVLAKRLSGQEKEKFVKGDLSTRLKMAGTDVVTIGDYLDPRGQKLVYQDEGHYRVIALNRRGHVIGAMAVGSWSELSAVQYARDSRAKLTKKQKAHFLSEGLIGGEDSLDLTQWPDKQLVCNCLRVSKGELCAALSDGADTCAKLREATGASTVCGSCEPLLQTLVSGQPPIVTARRGGALVVFSFLALVLGVLATVYRFPVPESVETLVYRIDELWRDTKIRQITGYVVLVVSVIGTLMSLRKRVSWLSALGRFANWRLFHSVFGLASLVTLFAHTGFRFGDNLNFWLMFTFIGLNILGAAAGIVAGLEANPLSPFNAPARRLRPVLTYAHIVLFWPFPVLLTFHIIKSYHW